MSNVDELYSHWKQDVYGALTAKLPERRARFESTSGYPVSELAGPWDGGGVEESYAQRIGFPGEYPFTRGVQPTMYRGRFWTMRQYAGFSTAQATNERYKFLLSSGQTGLSVAFDLPTQMGYDSTDSMAGGEVGKVGVAIDTVDDMRTLFDGIPQDEVTVSMTINAPATVLLMMYQLVAEEKGASPADLGGTIQNDILKEYMARGTYIFPPQPSMMLTVDSFRYCSRVLPKWNTISISGYHIREAGCTAVQEVAFTLADGIAYVEAALKAGLDVDQFGGRLSFFFNAHNNFLEEVAKFRAARRLWAWIMRERFGAKNPKSWMFRVHTQTAGSMLTAQQPSNNIVRVALQALAAVLGGTQSLHTNSFDEALALPSEKSVEIALRTQQIIAEESGVTETVDPLGGSWFIEDLTDRIEAGARAYIARIDEMGGMPAAIERGYPQAEIQQGAFDWQRSVEKKDRVIVGVNKYVDDHDAQPDLQRDMEAEQEQVERLEQYRANRAKRDPGEAWRGECEKLTAMADKGETAGYCEQMLAALQAGATEGEIIHALEAVWGRYRPGM
ncbi:methylmalonyl-CoA mutase [bacterium]|nr:methylmalonyl-CoA mutase [bacterium]